MTNNNEINEDLKFIPLNIKKQFIEKNSTWVPLIDFENLQVERLNENFLINFENNINNLSLEQRNIRVLNNADDNMMPNMKKEKFEENFDLEYPSETYEDELYSYNEEDCKKINSNSNYYDQSQNNLNQYNQNNKNQNNNYNYDNQNNYKNKNGYENNKGINTLEYYENQNNNYKYNNESNENKNYNNNNLDSNYYYSDNEINNKNNNNTKNNEIYKVTKDKNKDEVVEIDYYKELIHMSLLRNVDFNLNVDNNFRNNKLNSKIDKIFDKVKDEESIVETFKVYSIPKPISDLVIKKIIKMALENDECK